MAVNSTENPTEFTAKRFYVSSGVMHVVFDNSAIAFWPHAPEDRKARRQLEGQLVYKWRSPFNKENWRYWNTPFVHGKQGGSGDTAV